MATKRRRVSPSQRWADFDASVHKDLPHLYGWFSDVDEFRELRIKARPDGSTLAIAKGFGPDGGELVCFGVGYGVSAALMAIDATIQGGNWKVDKPWSPDGRKSAK